MHNEVKSPLMINPTNISSVVEKIGVPAKFMEA